MDKTSGEATIENIISFGVPHIGEQIFEDIGTDSLIQCLEVSETWNMMAEKVLLKRWKGQMYKACDAGKTKIVQLLSAHYKSEDSGLDYKDEDSFTPFMLSCAEGHTKIVQTLLEHSGQHIDLNAKNNYGATGFLIACIRGQTEVVKLLFGRVPTFPPGPYFLQLKFRGPYFLRFLVVRGPHFLQFEKRLLRGP